ncbi:MAG: GMC family oxidoreductase [Pseudomonadales bacterium]
MDRIVAKEAFDAIVVGSGAAGSVIAATFAEAGKSVLILEAGAERKLTDLSSSQIWARKLKWGGDYVEEEGNFKIGHAFNSGFGTGGSAVHHFGVWPRLHENDFSIATDYGRGLDWPIEYQTLQPYYDRIQDEVGLSGDTKAEKWRPPGKPYPMGPLPVFAQGHVLAKGFSELGLTTAPIPMAINSREYKGRSACLYDGWCDAGCPIGALANPLVTYLPRAIAAGGEIRHQATVARVKHNGDGRRATSVEYFDSQGTLREVAAKQVFLCAFAVQSARILLNSVSKKYNAGLSNSNDMVGRYLMTHPAQTVVGLMKDATQPHLGPTGGQLICHDNYANKQQSKEAFGSFQWLIANAVKPNDLLGIANSRPDIIGAELDPFMRKAAKHFAIMNLVGEDIAQAENRVTLSDKKDSHGIALARAFHGITDETKAMMTLAITQGKAVFEAAGAEEVWNGPSFGMHIMGGTVMGQSPKSSVTDSFGRCHELDNLFVAGTGVFPGSGAVNPTFTLHALALRTAEHALELAY